MDEGSGRHRGADQETRTDRDWASNHASDVAGLAGLTQLRPVIVEPIHRRLPPDHHVWKDPSSVDAEIATLLEHFAHFVDRGFEIRKAGSRLSSNRAHQSRADAGQKVEVAHPRIA